LDMTQGPQQAHTINGQFHKLSLQYLQRFAPLGMIRLNSGGT
jgi:hypothetical protein